MIFTQEVPLMQKWFSVRSRILLNWNLKMVIFEVNGNRRIRRKISQSVTKLTHIWPCVQNQTQTSLVAGECNSYYATQLPVIFLLFY